MVKTNFPSTVQQNFSISEEKFGAEVTQKANKQFYGLFLTIKLHRSHQSKLHLVESNMQTLNVTDFQTSNILVFITRNKMESDL